MIMLVYILSKNHISLPRLVPRVLNFLNFKIQLSRVDSYRIKHHAVVPTDFARVQYIHQSVIKTPGKTMIRL